MLKARARLLGALIVGAALALPLAAAAQSGQVAKPADAPKPPVTAPTEKANADKMPGAPAQTADAPRASSPPTPAKGSTAVPGWNNPPAWGSAASFII